MQKEVNDNLVESTKGGVVPTSLMENTDLLRFQTALTGWPHLFTQFSNIVSGIHTAEFHQNLNQWADQLDDLTRNLLAVQDLSFQQSSLEMLMEIISFLNEQVTCRIIQNAITTIEALEQITPPCPFCWISMGSDARQEQVVRTDQDNGLIFATPTAEKAMETDLYFLALAEQVVTDLDQFGFRRCTGDVMATNSVWRRSVDGWLQALDQWVGSTEPAALRRLTILLDFRALYGDKRLAQMVQARVFDLFHTHPSVSHFLAQDDRLFPSPKTLFGRIRTQRGKTGTPYFNLKTRALVHLTNGARILAMNHRIQIPSTLKRFQLLGEEQVLPPGEVSQYADAFRHLVRLKLTHHLSCQGKKNLPINCIDVSTLNQNDSRALMDSLETVIRLQKRIHDTYNQPWMNFFK
jgi:CBS domain-containing protein